jgi:hypothetical protein
MNNTELATHLYLMFHRVVEFFVLVVMDDPAMLAWVFC